MSAAWPVVSLGELIRLERRPVEVIDDRQYQEIGIYCFGRGIFHKTPRSGLEVGDKDLYQLREGDLILQVTFAWEGAIALCGNAEEGLYGSTRYPTFRVNEDRCFAPYIARYLCTPSGLDQINKICPGSAGRNRVLSIKRIPEIKIPLPPLAEQRRVVARIEDLAAQIHEARVLRQQATEEAEALLHAGLRQTRHRLLSSAHPKARLGSITKVTSGGTPSRENPAYWNGEIPWVKTGELLDDDIAFTEERITKAGVENSAAKIFPTETVLIALYGQGQTRGRTGRLLIPAATNQACCAILPNADRFEARYIQFWLRSLYMELRQEAQGGAQPNWNGSMIKNLEIALLPIPEQRRIVAELDALQAESDALKREQTETAAELDALLPAILDRAFRGEL
ncbi:MAG: restriction endonuclease subunit S [Betaproteobacteria bacterium]|nr:restriction endonuclease subunit S [Betaproteobacteria bacterium]